MLAFSSLRMNETASERKVNPEKQSKKNKTGWWKSTACCVDKQILFFTPQQWRQHAVMLSDFQTLKTPVL